MKPICFAAVGVVLSALSPAVPYHFGRLDIRARDPVDEAQHASLLLIGFALLTVGRCRKTSVR
jgi:hypothetical protein